MVSGASSRQHVLAPAALRSPKVSREDSSLCLPCTPAVSRYLPHEPALSASTCFRTVPRADFRQKPSCGARYDLYDLLLRDLLPSLNAQHVCEAHTPYRQNLVFLRLQPLKMVASLLAPVVAKAFQGPWDSEESRRVLSPEPQRLLARALGAASVQEVQDAAISLVLSEAVYKQLDDGGADRATVAVSELLQQYPTHLGLRLMGVRWEHSKIGYQVLVAEGKDALYVAFMGTKQRRDLLTNANAVLVPLWPASGDQGEGQGTPAAHRGFLLRAQAADAGRYLREAQSRGLRLVFCGHSLGGAVAQLCALDLLQAAAAASARAPEITSVGFATPAVGNAALAAHVAARGWTRRFVTYLLPEDVIGTFFNRSWSAAPAASGHAASGAKTGRRAALHVSLTVSAGCAVGTSASNIVPYAGAAPREVPRAWRDRPEAGAGLGPGLGVSPAARYPMRPIRTGGLFGRVRVPAGRVAAGALAPGVAGLRPLSPRSLGDTRSNPAQGASAAALRARGLCRACATGGPATAGPADAEGPLKEALSAAQSAVPALGFRLVAAAARARGLAGTLAGALSSALGLRFRLLATARALSGFAAWPLWAAAAAYAPLGCQRSLVSPCSGSGAVGNTPGGAADGHPARRGMFWMHRLPMYRGRLLAMLAAAAHTSSDGTCGAPSGAALARDARPLPSEARAMQNTPALPRTDAAAPGALGWAPQPAVRAGSLRPGAAPGADRAAVRSALRARPPARALQPNLLAALPRAGWRSDMHGVLVA